MISDTLSGVTTIGTGRYKLVGNFCVGAGLFIVLKLPLKVVLISSCMTADVSIIGGTILTKFVVDALHKSGSAQ
ncbi:hypothetical protein [Desulfosporosinus sp. Sb-LF]|uniref:hypothetical protein n=1 Tax=Desulfosporosinus sp. Sb-LF TaxID=2560027 RepID=UPI00107F53A5|nr:hypothetical protein [Desulfosporosinus sp. Sb-LF]TGE33521.1 hypothetical protein E4K68_05060 [Desulfosporosinus sp. Sb-LF]